MEYLNKLNDPILLEEESAKLQLLIESGVGPDGSLLSDEGKIVGGYIFSVDYLKRKIMKLKNENRLRLVMGGDFNVSKMALIPRKELFDATSF